MTERKKRNIIIGALCAVVLLMGVGYAAFQTVLNINGTSNITSNWNVKITNITSKNVVGSASNKEAPTFTDTSATFKTNLVSPGDSIEYEVTVSNEGNLNATLNKITLSDTNNPAIKFTTSGLTEGDVINAGSTSLLNVKVEFLSTVTSTPSNKTSDLTVTLDYSQATSGGTPSGETAADKLIETAVTTGDGLYIDTYETGRYVYKGANPANYITFNNEEWRIIAVEADGTLKIRKNASIANKPWDTTGGVYGSNNWARPATLNTYLNNDYYNILSNDDQNKIQSHSFGIGPVIFNNADLAAQIASENGTTWTGNIALMSLSDYIRANTNTEQCGNLSLNNTNSATCKTTDYLVQTSGALWTVSPDAYSSADVFSVSSYGYADGYARGDYAVISNAVLPVLHLKSDIILSGEGTSNNPYTIG